MYAKQEQYTKDCQSTSKNIKLEPFVLEHYFPFAQASKRSWKTEKRHIERHILPYFGKAPLEDISAQALIDWVNQLEQGGLSYSSRFRMFWLFKSVLNYAVRWGKLESDASFRSARLSARPGRKPEILGDRDILRLIDILSNSRHRAAADAIHLILLTGAGKSEVLYARWEDVNLEKGILATNKTFTGRTRLIPLNSKALALIHGLPRREDVPWLFYTRNGTRLTSVTRQWSQIREKLGRPELRLQDLRHNFAGILVDQGVNKKELQNILGHYKSETLELVRNNSFENKVRVQ